MPCTVAQCMAEVVTGSIRHQKFVANQYSKGGPGQSDWNPCDSPRVLNLGPDGASMMYCRLRSDYLANGATYVTMLLLWQLESDHLQMVRISGTHGEELFYGSNLWVSNFLAMGRGKGLLNLWRIFEIKFCLELEPICVDGWRLT
jgi:hypothetical protein